MSRVIFANVNPNSKYKDQRQPQPFPVVFELDSAGYHWKGGPGGRYKFSDLDLFIQRDGQQVPANTFAAGEQVQIMESFLIDMKAQADAGDLYPDWIEKTAANWIKQLNTIAKTARKSYQEEEE